MRVLSAVFMFLFTLSVSAADAPADSKAGPARGACRDEIRKVCGDIKPGDGKLKQCIAANQDKLSPGCRERMDHARDRAEAVHKACEADAQKLCTGVEPGGGRLHQCLMKNEASLSEECRAVTKHKPRHPRPAKDPS